MAGPHTARARARAQTLDEIKTVALGQLRAEGAAGLSLRAIARELGVVSSGMYRYYASRDELLTVLIVDAYADLAASVAAADADLGPEQTRRRLLARWTALRTWALAQPARFQLLYGSPVPGYRAPAETVGPATRVLVALLEVLADIPAGTPVPLSIELATKPSPELTAQLAAVADSLGLALPAPVAAAATAGFAELVGLVTLELGGHLVGGFEPADALVEHALVGLADRLGLAEDPRL